jgi:hypothetical protein
MYRYSLILSSRKHSGKGASTSHSTNSGGRMECLEDYLKVSQPPTPKHRYPLKGYGGVVGRKHEHSVILV